ncbi:hypothetical protein K457DRAFT_16186 [Linnemannia elongata AG-77]|uniref:F-box domain-containing protein n=1 Tax=Linnemannia elongata AG-77 TaxID=1314771 RepID=A0A197K4P9_9FUNG|nr:hypothetical protein K457DRAFT_16186 [Linnemannia elongata AG-77]
MSARQHPSISPINSHRTMDPLSSLPVECLRHIIHFISLDTYCSNNKRTLHALIRTNKHLALNTLPYLYSHPFKYTTHTRTYPAGIGIEPSSVRLTRMLLLQLLSTTKDGAYFSHLSTAVRLAYRLGDGTQEVLSTTTATTNSNTTTTTTSNMTTFSLDYMVHLRHLDIEWAAEGDYHITPKIKPTTDLIAFMGGDEYKHMMAFDQLLEAWAYGNGVCSVRLWCLWPILRREVTWAIAGPILEKLRSLVIPISDIERYRGVIGRLLNLEQVRFSLDEPFDYGEEYGNDLTHEFVTTTQRRKANALAATVAFVKEHTQLFPNRLLFVTYTSGAVFDFEEQKCPEETLLEIACLLPPLPQPLYLNERNWPRFAAAPLRIDLGAVESVVFPTEPQSWWYKALCENREFLRRCRSLRTLKMVTLGPGTFRWAVQERQDLDRLNGDVAPDTTTTAAATITNNNNLTQQQGNQRQFVRNIVPIQSVTISEHTTPFSDEINDIAIGFSQTLECLSIETSIKTGQPFLLEKVIHVGTDWINLPVLTGLYLTITNASLVLDRQIWAHCPSLTVLVIVDPTSRYRCQDIVPCLPGHHSNLETLWLQGSSALSFDSATLDSTPKLTSLHIFTGDGNDSHFFIPPVQELERSYGTQSMYGQDEEDIDEGGEGDASFQTGANGTTYVILRPRWTWNWDLPVLTYAMFTAEFAYRFQFRMLQKCPRLEFLILDMTSMDGPHAHTRVLSRADLFVSISSSASSDSYSDNIQNDERIVASCMHKLEFKGQWVIDDSLLPEYLAGMFPRLLYFYEKTFGGISLLGLLNVMREFAPDEGCEIEAEGEEEDDGRPPLSDLQGVTVDMSFNFADVELLDELGVYPLGYYRSQEELNTRVFLEPKIEFCGDILGSSEINLNRVKCVVLREPIH